jgi:uncharacterized protein (DUF1778 family)
MNHSSPAEKPENRLSIRATQKQKSILRRAAELHHMNVSQFVLQTSLDAAERLIREESTIFVAAEDFDWLCRVMDEPACDLPRLREALAQKPVWDA